MKANTKIQNAVMCGLRGGAVNFACAFLVCGVAVAQPTITTYAGNDAIFAGSGQPAVNAHLAQPAGVL
jgi:hypothetical protein